MERTQRVAVVTAAGGGIGRATVRRLLAQDYVVLALDHNPAALESLAADSGTQALHCVVADLTRPDDVARSFERVSRLGRLDVLINGVGSTCSSRLHDLSINDWQRLFDLNLTSVFLATRAALPLLEATPGDRAIINLSSTLAVVADPDTLAYGALKAGLEQMTRSLALELAPKGIRVVCVAPGPVAETGGEEAFETEANARLNPLGRFATVDEVAALIAFAASPESSYLTGTTLRLDGGDSALGAGWGPLTVLLSGKQT